MDLSFQNLTLLDYHSLWIVYTPVDTSHIHIGTYSTLELLSSDVEVKRSEPVKLSTQLYRKKDYYSKFFKTVHAVAILWS